ncbi:heavy-metal-associated domain-containing protein [Glutamicibacter sp. MNS18]|uniref:heavy-metal-associated domain-containing protein n=1 Tax=Glutamicibacter sp. MNS18 TaxID=2989817 RepID=UPI002236ABD8|nr:heavy-metal-associated domain-containing protein [Glutamicibacter sp. MNS18]MCW4465462.1 heavy-metal-associated domain-containing protein [Glutamicibacter sp. MNS18]
MSTHNGCGCGCSENSQPMSITRRPEQEAGPVRTELRIQGMTCGHCVASVGEELRELAGVAAVDITLVAGGTSTAVITSTTALDEAALRAAIDEAGYELNGIGS